MHADTLLGVYAGAGSWQQDYSGSVTTLDTTLDIEDDLGLSAEANNVFYAALEHPVPLLPNLRAAYADLDTRANVTLIQDVGFAGANFTSATDVSTQLSVAQGDASFYYEMLDNWVSLDLGMTLRYLDGHIEVLSSSQLARADVRGVLPLLYGVVRFDLPLS